MFRCLAVVALTVSVVFAQSESPNPFRGPVAEWLQADIQRRIAKIKEEAPLSEQQQEELGNKLNSVNLKYSSKNRDIWDFFRDNRKEALPILEAALRHENSEVRQKARLCLVKEPKEYQTVEYKKAEEVMVLLLLRSANDKDVDVRRGSAATLGGIAFEDHRTPRSNPNLHMNRDLWDRVVSTLNEFLSDSDELVADLAAVALYRIGEGPRPTEEEY